MSKTAVFPMSAFPTFASCSFDCAPWDGPDPADDSYPCITEIVQAETSCFSYVGTAPTSQQIDLGYQPDLVWLKNADNTYDWRWTTSLDGEDYFLESNTNDPLTAYTSTDNFNFLTDGFEVGNGNSFNENGSDHFGIALKEAPGFFDMVHFTGTGTTQNVAHGLGVVPELIIAKRLDGATSWTVYHKNASANPELVYLVFNSTNGINTEAAWGNTAPTSTQFSVGWNNNISGYSMSAFLFASVPGKCKIGYYDGNTTTPPTINTGFQASYIMIKRTAVGTSWSFISRCMNGVTATDRLRHDTTAALDTDSGGWVKFNPTNVEILTTNTSINETGYSYIYMVL